jgi:hypothetical protein
LRNTTPREYLGSIAFVTAIKPYLVRQDKLKYMTKKVVEVFIETLVNAGVKRVYGVVGDSISGLTEVIRKSKQIELLHVRHEEVAAFAAGAETHLIDATCLLKLLKSLFIHVIANDLLLRSREKDFDRRVKIV